MSTNSATIQIDFDDDRGTAFQLRPSEERIGRLLEETAPSLNQSKVRACLQCFLRDYSNVVKAEQTNSSSFARDILSVVDVFTAIESSNVKLQCRKALMESSENLISGGGHEALIAATLVSIALAMEDPTEQSRFRSIGSAMAKVITAERGECRVDGSVEHDIFRALLQQATQVDDKGASLDWHIISSLAKSLNVQCLRDNTTAQAAAKIISDVLHLSQFKSNDNSMDASEMVSKTDAAAILALAAQLQPWQVLKPADLIILAVLLGLDHAAERICEAVTTSSPESDAAKAAVETLLEGSFDSKQYRQADNYATKFFDSGGNRRFLEARYLHACSTIAKVIRKGALPVIDKQIERVDKAVQIMEKNGTCDTVSVTINCETAAEDIRIFALEQLEETDNADACHRFAALWGMDYCYDEEAILKAADARRKKYLQWEDLLSEIPPELVSTPATLLDAMRHLGSTHTGNIYGFDTEWSDEDIGVSILQIASLKSVVLLDIPALSNSAEGCEALEKTVGRMFANCTMVGFSCRQDITKLRGSPTKSKDKKHWLHSSEGVVDLQPILAKTDASSTKLGLSRVCERFLGKPLDKSEQCSLWNARPLSLRQRTYAALDAWTVRSIYDIVSVAHYR